jgi:hypothetical protein
MPYIPNQRGDHLAFGKAMLARPSRGTNKVQLAGIFRGENELNSLIPVHSIAG